MVKELFNAAHMDGLVLPLVLAAIWLTIRRRTSASMILLVLAVGAKLWPVILLPVLLRRAGLSRRQVAEAAAMFIAMTALLLWPMLSADFDQAAGVRAYAEHWENNAGIYVAVRHAWTLAVADDLSYLAARITLAAMLLAWIAWLVRTPSLHPSQFVTRCLAAVAGLFLLSPTQFPWYYTWLVPLLAVSVYRPLLLYTALLPLYHMNHLGEVVRWVQHVPVYAAIAARCASKRHPLPGAEAAHA